MKIQAPYIANLFEYATYKGISEDLLRNNLIEKHIDVCNQNNTVTEKEYLAVFETLLNKTNDKNFGIHYACYLNLKALGFIVQLSLHASSIAQAVFVLQNYLSSTFPLVNLEVEEKKKKYILNLSCKIETIKLKNQVLDFIFCFVFRELKLMLSNDWIPECQVPKSNHSEFKNIFNVEMKRGGTHRFIFDKAILNVEINKKRLNEIEILLPKFLQMLDKKKSGYKAFSMQVRNAVLNLCCPELPSFEQVVIHFPLSHRTFQRKLTNEGMSFRKIADDIKNELSSYLSKGHKMKTQDIAYLLGYSDASAYLHVVKKWEMQARE